jgi:spore maturation protein CgeB
MNPITILFVHASAEWATKDVGEGYARALKRMGHNVVDYRTPNRLKYHALALSNSPDPNRAFDAPLVSRLASEGIVVEALREKADLVIVTAGGGIHPDGLELCARAGFPVAVIFTESPYEDEAQCVYARHAGYHFTNDRLSADRYGWTFTPCSYDPEVHHPYDFDLAEECDVLVSGSGWPERQKLLESVDWTGIRFRLIGQWPGVTEESPLWPHYEAGSIDNDEQSRLYSSARIVVNAHRYSPDALSLNPRAYEAAACGVFQVSDYRADLDWVFGKTVPVYRGGAELGEVLRWHLALSDDRLRSLAHRQRERVLAGGHTFDDRAAVLISTVAGVRP